MCGSEKIEYDIEHKEAKIKQLSLFCVNKIDEERNEYKVIQAIIYG